MKALLDVLAPASEDYALARAIDPDRLPAHIAIIMDGNGRWAKRRRLPRAAGHRAGVQPVRSTVETCARLGLRALTLYAFSVENWKRPRAEVETLWRLLRRYLCGELDLMHRHDIRFTAIGRLHALPDFVREELDSVIRSTAGNKGLQLNLAINYGGRAEIVDAVAALVEDAVAARLGENGRARPCPTIDEAAISERLYTAGMPDPDLLIRTSGEMRVSNFLLWQIAYAELYVTETLWPDFSRAELLRAILDYQKRDRRFGGLTPSSLDGSLGTSLGTSGNHATRAEGHPEVTPEHAGQPNTERNVDPDVESGAVETVGVPSR
jgi:undecaprenyl diphosphate synthase